MDTQQIEKLCKEKETELLTTYFGNLTNEAALIETIGEYTKDLPLKIEEEYKNFLRDLWINEVPNTINGAELVLMSINYGNI